MWKIEIKNWFNVPSSDQTKQFYDDLMEGDEKRGIFGKDTRFNAVRVSQRESVHKYFGEVIKPYIKKNDRVLDFGCGPGSFVAIASKYCDEIIGVDISTRFTSLCEKTIQKLNLKNAKALQIFQGNLPFQNHSFDVVIMVDVLHHLDNISKDLEEALRVLKSGGQVLIFEPNKLNPLIAVMHALDRNEWGLLKLGTPRIYKKILTPYLEINEISFNGIVIGPESSIFPMISDLLDKDNVKPLLGWLNPKIFISGRKR